ncbi:hypothetical protein BGX34_011150, partial [Mortierella sp. NVP85]
MVPYRKHHFVSRHNPSAAKWLHREKPHRVNFYTAFGFGLQQMANIIPADASTTALRAMNEGSGVGSESFTEAVKSSVINDALEMNNAAAVSLDGQVVEQLLSGNRGLATPSSIASDTLQDQYDFWSKTLADAPAILDLPTDRPRASHQSINETNIPIQLDAPLTQSLKKLALEHDVDLAVVVMVAWGVVLARLSGQDDIIMGFHQDDKQIENSNILLLRLDLSGGPNTSQLLERVQKMASPMDHRCFPLDSIAKIASWPLFRVAFQWNNQASLHSDPSVQVDLELQLQELDNEVSGTLLFSSELFNHDSIRRHVGYLVTVLRTMVKDSARPVAAIDILSPEERRLVLETWNEPSEAYPDHSCFHRLFEIQVDKTPDATAIVCGDLALSYGDLNSRANRLSHHLIRLGVGPDTRVAICVERSLGMIVGILAIMKAGGAYVPLDPSYANGRLQDILQDASPSIIVADQTGQAVLGDSALTIVDPNSSLDHSISNPCIPGLTSRHLAYIIYTSGSTGKPKGVMIEHRGVVNLAQTHTKFCGIDQNSRVLQFASLSFDASVWDIMLPLSCGASLFIPHNSVRQDRYALWKYMAHHSVTHASFTPSFLQDGKNLPAARNSLTLVLGGEPLSSALLQNLISQGYTVINDFGPTELTVSATTWRCPPDFKGDIVPIGRPVIHSRIYLLDKHGQPVPIGAIGEMYVGGIGVARGYLNRPELTTERFLPDPFSGDAEARMYRTGDLARYLPDGNIVFVGRNDDQVKIRGFRIELGEIESRLSEHPLVQQAAVLALGEDEAKRLVAYVAAKPEDQLVNTLRSYLASCLPHYMIPAAIVRLDTLPLTSSDKID